MSGKDVSLKNVTFPLVNPISTGVCDRFAPTLMYLHIRVCICISLFGQCPNIGGINSKGCSLNIYLIIWIKYHLYPKRLISKNKPSLIELEYISRWTSFLLFPPNCKSYFAKFPSRRYWLWKAAGSHFKFHNKPAWLKCFEQSGMN